MDFLKRKKYVGFTSKSIKDRRGSSVLCVDFLNLKLHRVLKFYYENFNIYDGLIRHHHIFLTDSYRDHCIKIKSALLKRFFEFTDTDRIQIGQTLKTYFEDFITNQIDFLTFTRIVYGLVNNVVFDIFLPPSETIVFQLAESGKHFGLTLPNGKIYLKYNGEQILYLIVRHMIKAFCLFMKV